MLPFLFRLLVFDVHIYLKIPNSLFFREPVLDALVVKDRNPLGKFKLSPKFLGVVTVFISIEGLCQDALQYYMKKLKRDYITRNVFNGVR